MTNYSLISIAAASAALLGMAACTPKPAPPAEAPSRPVKLFEVPESSVFRSLSLPAVIDATDKSVLTFQVGGRIAKLDLKKGAEVRRGDVLAELDQREFRNAVTSAQSDYDLAESIYQRSIPLKEQNAIAQATFDERKAQRDSAKARLDSVRKNFEDSILRAPFDGIVADTHVEAFETIGPQTPIVSLQAEGNNLAVVQIPASLVIVSNQIETESLTLKLNAAPHLELPAELVDGAAIADPGTQTFEARFSFQNPQGLAVFPGMTGTLSGVFKITTEDDAEAGVEIPVSAVLGENGDTFVWVYDPASQTVAKREVIVRVGRGTSLVVEDGLSAGEQIVSAGVHYVQDGSSVRPLTE